MTTQKLSVIQIARRFPYNEVAENWFIKHRRKNGVECTHCNSKRVTERRKAGKRAFRCKDCRKDFSSKTGSLMHDSKIGFREWAIAIFLMAINIKGTSSTKLAHDLGISQKSAWFMAMRIREAHLYSPANMDAGFLINLSGSSFQHLLIKSKIVKPL